MVMLTDMVVIMVTVMVIVGLWLLSYYAHGYIKGPDHLVTGINDAFIATFEQEFHLTPRVAARLAT